MDLQALANESPKIMSVIQSMKNDPTFLEEFKANPQAALDKIGVELNEDELALLQKFEGLRELEAEAEGFFSKIKGLFGFKDPN